MTAWMLEETTLCMLLFFFSYPEMAKMQAPVSQHITACLLTYTGTINGTHVQWNTGPNTNLFSAVRVGYCFALSSRPIARMYCKPLQTKPSVKHTVLVQTCGSASRQSGSDKSLKETWTLICNHWKGMEHRNTEQTAEEDHPSGNTWKILYTAGWHIGLIWDLVSWVHLLSPQNPLWHILLMHECPGPSWNLKHFTSVLFLAMVFTIFISLCELLPKMSNPLQACL